MKALLLLLVATGCDVRYLARGIVDGQRTYDIECKNDFALCREKASDLCPGGYDTVRSRKVQGFDHDPARRPLLNRYELDIACRDFDRSK